MKQTKPLASGFPVSEVIETLRRQLAEYQERLTKALALVGAESQTEAECNLREMIAKAGEVMRERCADFIQFQWEEAGAAYEIRALPGVTLEDIQK